VTSEELRQLAAMDVRQPWFAPYAGWLEAGRRAMQSGLDAAAALGALAPRSRAAVPRFVDASVLPQGEAYEAFIARTGTVPTRDNLHDFFNGVVWLRFTRAKRRLNELQAAEIARAGIGPRRGAVRDALTLFDENGALLAAPPLLRDALLQRDWRRLFVELRPLWGEAALLVFGHALLEKLLSPYKELTAHVWRGDAAAARLDSWIAGELTVSRLAEKPFAPLPLMGIPGWWSGNEHFSFYDDPFVFRPAGAAKRERPAIPPLDAS
jgi:hypothetical protein